MSLKGDINNLIDEIYTGQQMDNGGKSASMRAGVLKLFSGILKASQQGFAKMLEEVNTHNTAVYNKKLADAQNESNSSGFKWSNWWSQGYEAQKLNRKICQDQKQYLEAMKRNLEVFKQLIQTMIKEMTDGLAQMPENSAMGMLALSVASGLGALTVKLDEFGKQIDDKMEEVNKKLEEMEAIDDCDAAWDKMWSGGWDEFWSGMGGCLRAGQNWLGEELGVGGAIIGQVLNLGQMGINMTRNPVEFCLTLVANILDVIATALNYIGEFVDHIIWTLFGWAYDNENWTSGEGWEKAWASKEGWGADGGYGTHGGVGDAIQWIGRVVVDEILDNIVLDNLVDGIRFVLYEGISRAWNYVNDKLGGYGILLVPGGMVLDSLEDPGQRDYFGIEDFDPDGDSSDGIYYSSNGKAVKWAEPGFYNSDAIQDLHIDQLVKVVRGNVVKAQNAYRMAAALAVLKSEIRNTVYRELTGLSGFATNAELVAAGADLMTGPTTQIVDAALSQLMMRAAVFNQLLLNIDTFDRLEQAKAMQAAAIVLMIASVVIAAICTVASLGSSTPAWVPALTAVGAACAALGATAALAASQILSDIDTPNVSAPTPSDVVADTASTGETVVDVFNSIDAEIAQMESALAKGDAFLVKTKDGMYHLDSKAIANFERKLNALNNAIRVLFYLAKQKQDINRLVKATFGGSLGESTIEGLTMKSVEALLAQRQAVASAITFQLSQYITARNMETQKQIALGKMNAGAAGQSVGAIAGFIVSLLPAGSVAGAFINLGAAIAGSAVSIGLAASNESRNISYRSNDKEMDAFLANRAANDDSIEGKLDRMEAQAMLDFLANGLIGTGDGYHGLNNSQLAKTIKQIQRIFTLKQVLSDALTLGAKVRAAVQRELTGVAPGTAAEELTKSVNQASFSAALRIVSNLAADLRTTAAVMNQGRDAEKQLINAGITGGINIACSAASMSLMATTSAGSFGMALAEVLPALGNLAANMYSVIEANNTTNADIGALKNYNVNDTVDEMNGKKKSEKTGDWTDELDAREDEIMRQMSTDLINSLDYGLSSVSGDTALVNTRMERLYNAKLAIAMAMQIMREIKAAMGKFQASTSLTDIVEANRSAALSILEALKGTLESIVQRENQKREAYVQMTQAFVGAAVSTISLSCSIARAGTKKEIAQIDKQIAESYPAQSNVDKEKLNSQKGELIRSMRNVGKLSSTINLVGRSLNALIPLCFTGDDEKSNTVHNDLSGKKTDGKEKKEENNACATEEREEEGAGFAGALDSMESDIETHQYMMAQSEEGMDVLGFKSMQADAALSFFKMMPESSVYTIQSFLNPDIATVNELEKATASDQTRAGEAGAAAAGNPAAAQQVVTHQFQRQEQAARSQKVLADSLDALTKSFDAKIESGKAAQVKLEQEVSGLKGQFKTAPNQAAAGNPEQLTKTEIKTLIAQKQAEIAQKQAEITALVAQRNELATAKGTAALTVVKTANNLTSLEQQYVQNKKEIAALRQELESGKLTAAERKTKQADLTKKENIKIAINDSYRNAKLAHKAALAGTEAAKGKIDELMGEIKGNRGEIKELNREIAALQTMLKNLGEAVESGSGSTTQTTTLASVATPAAQQAGEQIVAAGQAALDAGRKIDEATAQKAADAKAANAHRVEEEQDIYVSKADQLIADLNLRNKDENTCLALLKGVDKATVEEILKKLAAARPVKTAAVQPQPVPVVPLAPQPPRLYNLEVERAGMILASVGELPVKEEKPAKKIEVAAARTEASVKKETKQPRFAKPASAYDRYLAAQQEEAVLAGVGRNYSA